MSDLKFLYLCDGTACEFKSEEAKNNCYLFGGSCRHTSKKECVKVQGPYHHFENKDGVFVECP